MSGARLAGLLRRVVDHNKHVQAAACGALAALEQEARTDIAPYLGPIVGEAGPRHPRHPRHPRGFIHSSTSCYSRNDGLNVIVYDVVCGGPGVVPMPFSDDDNRAVDR